MKSMKIVWGKCNVELACDGQLHSVVMRNTQRFIHFHMRVYTGMFNIDYAAENICRRHTVCCE